MNAEVARRAGSLALMGLGFMAVAACSNDESSGTTGATATSSVGVGGSSTSSGAGATSSSTTGIGGATGSGGASTTSTGGSATVGVGGAGGTTVGAGGGMMGSYLACAMQNCPTELSTCQADTACACVATCIDGGTGEGQCKQTCSLDPQNAAWTALVTCTDMSGC